MQLELGFWPLGTLRASVDDFLARCCGHLSAWTILDYDERAGWLYKAIGEQFLRTDAGNRDYGEELCRAAGETCQLQFCTYRVLTEVATRWRARLKLTTIRRRFTFLIAVMKYQAEMGVIEKNMVPSMPKWIIDDGERGGPVIDTIQYQALKLALPPGRWRRCAGLVMWTGSRNQDLYRYPYEWLEPEYVWRGVGGVEIRRGRYLRATHKNRKKDPVWLPMEEEFQKEATEWLANPDPSGLVVGHVWASSIRTAFTAASERAEIPRMTPRRLRSSFACMLAARDYHPEYIRQAMGHEGAVPPDVLNGALTGRLAARPAPLERHYLSRPTEEFLRAQAGKKSPVDK